MQNHNEILLQNIKKHKKRHGLSNDALALSIGVSHRQVSRWMNGASIPGKHHEKIANVLNVDLLTLKSESDDSDPGVMQLDDAEIELFPLNCRVSQHSLNGFSLIKSRFGLSRSEIVEWAPALFYLLASQAVEDLQKWVDRFEEQVENAPEGFTPDEEYQLDFKNKRKMLDARDVLGVLYGRTYDHARIPFIDAFIKLANDQRNEISPEYFGDRDLEGHLPHALVRLDWTNCMKLARGDEALASAIQDSSILGPVNESDEALASAQQAFENFLQSHREIQHARRRYYEQEEARNYEQEKERSLDKDTLTETKPNGLIKLEIKNTYRFLQPTRAWQEKLWRELDNEYGEFQYAERKGF